MPNTTPNLGLIKPLVTEQYDIAKVTNENADILDLEVSSKQDILVSGTNIKTINGNSVLGSGDIPTMLPKNWIINGMFDVWQRGTSQTISGYGSDDRFINEHGGSTKTHSQQVFTVGQTTVPNNPKYFSRTVVTSVAGVGNYVAKVHRIEDVTKLAGKTIAVSFWAKADANKNITIEFRQFFGTGGSVTVSEIGVQKFALTTSWQKFTKLITLPSVVGKTITADSYLQMTIWLEAGSNFNLRTDSLGQQSGTFDIANVSLVEGSVAVECQNQPYADVLRECQDYYRRRKALSAYYLFGNGFAIATTTMSIVMPLSSPMRRTPTLSFSGAFGAFDGASVTAASNLTLSTNTTADFIEFNLAVPGVVLLKNYQFVSNGDINAYIELSSEL